MSKYYSPAFPSLDDYLRILGTYCLEDKRAVHFRWPEPELWLMEEDRAFDYLRVKDYSGTRQIRGYIRGCKGYQYLGTLYSEVEVNHSHIFFNTNSLSIPAYADVLFNSIEDNEMATLAELRWLSRVQAHFLAWVATLKDVDDHDIYSEAQPDVWIRREYNSITGRRLEIKETE